MLQALTLTLSFATAMPAPNQTELAARLAAAIANQNGFHAATVYVGSLPPNLSITAALPSFTLRGSLVQKPDQASRLVVTPSVASTTQTQWQPITSSTLFYEIPTHEPGALARYEESLAHRGWHDFALMPIFQYGDKRQNRFYCSSMGFLQISEFRALPNTIAITTSIGSNAAMWCKMMSMVPIPPSAPPFPTLRAPRNARVGVDVVGTTTVGVLEEALVTTRPVAAVGNGFAHQLMTKGWSANPPAITTTGYLQTFNLKQHGLNYQIVLALVRTGRARYTLNLNESLLDGPPFPLPEKTMHTE